MTQKSSQPQAHPQFPISSMTAFARVQHDAEWGTYAWEVRSVNHRYLEANFKLPERLRSLEPALRSRLRESLARGKVESALHFKLADHEQTLAINHQRVEEILGASRSLAARHAVAENLSARDLLQWSGVLQANEQDVAAFSDELLEGFQRALLALQTARETEGQRMAAVLIDKLSTIEALVDNLRGRMPEILAEQQSRLEARIQEFDVDIDRDRLAQEMVLIGQKADVAEELDRLVAHVQEVRATLASKEPCGRRLDFLMQELNREANTLGSKSIALDSSQGAVSLKVLIEQMREQIQNIE